MREATTSESAPGSQPQVETRRLIALLPDAWTEYRDRGLALAELGERARARADLSLYLQEAGDTSDREAMADRLAELGRSMS